MTDSPDGEQGRLRIGTAERERAMELLSQQFSDGRLDVDEFSDRSAKISAAVTRADLEPIFADLPVKPSPPPALSTDCCDVEVQPITQGRDWRSIAMAVTPLIALGVTMLGPWHNVWLVWLAVPVVGVLLYGTGRGRH
jgi:hypothetical protein